MDNCIFSVPLMSLARLDARTMHELLRCKLQRGTEVALYHLAKFVKYELFSVHNGTMISALSVVVGRVQSFYQGIYLASFGVTVTVHPLELAQRKSSALPDPEFMGSIQSPENHSISPLSADPTSFGSEPSLCQAQHQSLKPAVALRPATRATPCATTFPHNSIFSRLAQLDTKLLLEFTHQSYGPSSTMCSIPPQIHSSRVHVLTARYYVPSNSTRGS
jgi:hypothetical protein